MNVDSIPGLTIHQHEGRFTGVVDMPPADLAAVSWNGRVMLVVMADVGGPMRITTDKEDTNKAHWTYGVVDAAIVRDQSMRDHLEKTLHIDAGGVEPHALEDLVAPLITPPGLMGVYDEEGAFLGFRREDDFIEGDDPRTISPPKTTEPLDDDILDEDYEDEVPTARIVEEEEPKKPLFSTPKLRQEASEANIPPERTEVVAGPIIHKDRRLQAFLDDDRE